MPITKKIIEKLNAMTQVNYVFEPLDSVDAYVALDTVECKGFLNKTILVNNPGAKGIKYKVDGSMDDGTTFDVVVQAEAIIATLGQAVNTYSHLITHFKVSIKSESAGQPSDGVQLKTGLLNV